MNTLSWAIAFAASAAFAQQPPQPQVKHEIHFEQYDVRGVGSGLGSEPVIVGMIGPDGRMGLLNVTGKPFSATETRRTVQMLANGTKIESSDSNQLYRDDQGRTRVEQTFENRTTAVIMDPVAHYVAVLNRAEKTAHRNSIPAEVNSGSVSVAKGKIMVLMGNNPEGPGAKPVAIERLGDREVNGVMATGTRKIRTIPAGAIGNDRELQLVDETWFSNDLQVVVKSISTDPRFGDTTYQLTNIVRAAQDPTLFQVPSDYTVTDRPPLPPK